MGTPAPASDIDDVKGEWTGGKGAVYRVGQDPGSGQLTARVEEDGKEQIYPILLTTVGKDVVIVWVKDKELGAYLPFRIAPGDESVALLCPDEDVVKALVTEGKLIATYDKEKKAWVISKGESEALLLGKEFWSIDYCMPLFRSKEAKKTPAEATTSPAAPAARHP